MTGVLVLRNRIFRFNSLKKGGRELRFLSTNKSFAPALALPASISQTINTKKQQQIIPFAQRNCSTKKITLASSNPSSFPHSNLELLRTGFAEATTFFQILNVFNKYHTFFLNEEKNKAFKVKYFSGNLCKDQIAELLEDELSELQNYLIMYGHFLELPDFVKNAFFQGTIHRLINDLSTKPVEDISERILKLSMVCKALTYRLTIKEREQILPIIQTLDSTALTSSFPRYCNFISLGVGPKTDEKVDSSIQSILAHFVKFENVIDQIPLEDASRFVVLLCSMQTSGFPDEQSKAVYLKFLLRVLEVNYNLDQPPERSHRMIYYLLSQLAGLNINKEILTPQQIDRIMTGIEKELQSFNNMDHSLALPDILGTLRFQFPNDLKQNIWDIITVRLGDELIRKKWFCSFDTFSNLLSGFRKINYSWKEMPVELRAAVILQVDHLINQGGLEKELHHVSTMIGRMAKIRISWNEMPRKTQDTMMKLSTLIFKNPALSVLHSKGLMEMGVTWEMIPKQTRAALLFRSMNFIMNGMDQNLKENHRNGLIKSRRLFANLSFDWNLENKDNEQILLSKFATKLGTLTSHNFQRSMAWLASSLCILGLRRVSWKEFPQESLKELWSLIDTYLKKTEKEVSEETVQDFYYALSLMDGTFYNFSGEKNVENILHRFESNPKLFSFVWIALGQKTNWKQLENRQAILQLVHGQLELEKRDKNFPTVFSKILYGLTLMTFDWLDDPLTAETKDEFIQMHRPILQILFSEFLFDEKAFTEKVRREVSLYFDWLQTLPTSLKGPLLQAVDQKEIPIITISKDFMTPRKKTNEILGHELLSYLGRSTAATTNGFEVISNYRGLPSQRFPMPLAVKFNTKFLVFINFVDSNPYVDEESLPYRNSLLLEYLYGFHYRDVGVIRIEFRTIANQQERQIQIKEITDMILSLAASQN